MKGLSSVLQARTPRVTSLDVAARSGLPFCTVPRALRNLPDVSGNTMAESGEAADPDLVVDAGSSIEGGRATMTELIENRRMPSAIFAGCDDAAFGALLPLRELGLSAPKKVSIMGLDDHQMSWFLGLTTIAQPVADQGAFAANLLIAGIHRPVLPHSPSSHLLGTKLVERRSTRRRR